MIHPILRQQSRRAAIGRCAAFALLGLTLCLCGTPGALAQPAAAAAPDVSVRYLLHQPDGEEFYWTLINHDDSGWTPAASLTEVAALVRERKLTDLWIRIKVNHTPATLNNSWFRIRHSGPFEIDVNGNHRVTATQPSAEPVDYRVSPRRPERLGDNIYAIHFHHAGAGDPVFEIEFRQPPWMTTDDGAWRPAPLLPDGIRDAQVTRGLDGAYYMTGTTGPDDFIWPNPDVWLRSPGIQLFRSTDLKDWKTLGFVWTFERDGTWNKDFGKFGKRGPARGIFAPEVHIVNGEYWLSYSVNHTNENHDFGIGLLHAKQPEGPYTEVSPDRPVTGGFDSNLFQDDDGTVYLLKHGGQIARMKPDMTGVAEPFRHLAAANFPNVGYEGVNLFKYKGRYYLTSAEWNVHADGVQSYDSMIASSDKIEGPYGDRYCALRFGGHNGYFEGPDGQIYATVWCYPDSSPHWQQVSIVKMRLDEDGRFHVVPGGE